MNRWIRIIMVFGIVTLITGVVSLFFIDAKIAFGFIILSMFLNTVWIVMRKENDKSKKK